MKKLLLGMILLSFFSCNKNAVSDVDYCKFARVRATYDFMLEGEEVKGCEILSKESKEGDFLGQKLMAHQVKMKVNIEQVVDSCNSSQGLNCNLLNKNCIMDNGKKANFCKYPDAKVVTAKGAKRQLTREIVLFEDPKTHQMSVAQNNELK